MKEVKDVLANVGIFTDFYPVRREGLTVCIYATTDDRATLDDVLTIPWGRNGQRRVWPGWWVDRARPRGKHQNDDATAIELTAAPDKANKRRLEWREVARVLKKNKLRYNFVKVRGATHNTATIEIGVPASHAESARALFAHELTVSASSGDTWCVAKC